MILVTGANGFLGKEIVKYLQGKNVALKLTSRNRKKLEELSSTNDEIIEIEDIFSLSENQLFKLLSKVNAVIHTAWFSNEKNTYSSDENINCLIGTLELAKAVKKNNIRKFIGIGTCAEYDADEKLMKKDSKVKPQNLYAASKLSTYFILQQIFKNSKTQFLWCRVFFLYGNGDKPYKLSEYIKNKLEKNQEVPLTEGTQIRDFIHVKKAASKIAKYSLNDKSGIINICSGKPQTVREFAMKIAFDYGKEKLLKFGLRERNLFDPDYIVGISSEE